MRNDQEELWQLYKDTTRLLHSRVTLDFPALGIFIPESPQVASAFLILAELPGGQRWTNSIPHLPLWEHQQPHTNFPPRSPLFQEWPASPSEKPGEKCPLKISRSPLRLVRRKSVRGERGRIEDTEFGHSSPGMRSPGWWKQSQRAHSPSPSYFHPH